MFNVQSLVQNRSNPAFRPINWPGELAKIVDENGGWLNMTYEMLDRHLTQESRNKTALRHVGKNWPTDKLAISDISYENLADLSNRFANGLKKLGLKKGDRIFGLSPRIPEFYAAVLGSLRLGCVFSPLFSAFGPEPIAARMAKGEARALFTLASYYKKKIAPIRNELKHLEYLIVVDDTGELKNIPGAIDFNKIIEGQESSSIVEKTSPDDMALIHFTSGTTGKPKGAVHVHGAQIFHKISGKYALDLKENDIFWCTADPGWVTGMSYGIISPLSNGVTSIVDQAEFQADRWYRIIQDFGVTVWYTAPTALRMLMKAGSDLPKNYNLKSVRFAASVGEPLNPEVIHWAKEALGILIHDNWWQTETGGILISNYSSMEVRPGSMGKPMPGIEVKLVKRTGDSLTHIENPGEQGEIAIHKGWPALFKGYLGDEERYRNSFVGDWYLSGDLAYFDQDGYFWFVGRIDDVIKSSGHLIGPFEVESILMEHPAVLEAGVIGKPDPVTGEVVLGFVVLKKDYSPSEDLMLDILGFSRKRLGAAVAPREIRVIDNLPKTRSGKIMRRLLKARELGLPEGDLSTLETGS